MIKALSLIQACPAGEHYSEAWGGCVVDDPGIIIPVGGGTTADPKMLMYAGIGLALLLLLSAFAGGRASKKSSSSRSRPYSRTTTRTLFA